MITAEKKIKIPRIASRGIKIDQGVEVQKQEDTLVFRCQGKEARRTLPEYIVVNQENGVLHLVLNLEDADILKKKNQRTRRSQLGTFTSLLQADLDGLKVAFTKILELVGVGYKAEVHKEGIKFSLGYSHDVIYALPSGVTLVIEKPTLFKLSSSSKELLGHTVSEILKLRKIEPYKGKGVRIQGQYVRIKQGKTK